MSWWPAPHAHGPVIGTVRVPGSKSASNRALVLGALAAGPSVAHGVLDARDTRLMIDALTSLGHGFDVTPDTVPGTSIVRMSPGSMRASTRIDCGLAGTVMRFVPPVAGLNVGHVTFDGDEGARVRPMGTLLGALRHLGVDIDDEGRGRLPFTVVGHGHVPGGSVTLDASSSSQFVSGLLLSAARFESGATIHHVGPPVPSIPHIDMTVAMLAENGVRVRTERAEVWHVDPQEIAPVDRVIEPDLSNAAPFLAAALVTQGTVTVADWPRETSQPGAAVVSILEQMGASREWTESGLTIHGGAAIRGVDVDLSDVGELTPTIAALAALADSPSTLTGIAHLRGHETDRLAALATELSAVGASVDELDDGLRITPRDLHAADLRTYHDHRMATAAAILGLRIPGVRIEDIATTAKTLPDFPGMWTSLVEGA